MWLELMPVIAQLAAITAGVYVVVWQIGRQHKNSLQLQKENHQDDLKLSLYRDLSNLISSAQAATGESSGYVSSLHVSLIISWTTATHGFPPKPLSERPAVFADKHRFAYHKIAELMVTLERYDIVNADLRIFRTAFAVALQDLTTAQIPLYTRMLSFLPFDVPLEQQSENTPSTIFRPVPTLEEYNDQIKPLVEAYSEAAMTLSTYIHDLAIETQNILLGNLFKSRIPRRKPLDPQYVVISTAPGDLKKLEKYFEEKISTWSVERQGPESAIGDRHQRGLE